MDEKNIQSFWNAHPCGEQFAGGLQEDYQRFFDEYDAYRYRTEGHILTCLDACGLEGQNVLEIGLGQGADSEQIIRRGGNWHGLDLTPESVDRVKTRMALKSLPYRDIKQGSALEIPYEDNQFDVVYSHGVLHHIPDIGKAQQEISRVLKPQGRLIIMLYAKWSLNYLLSIVVVRRIGLLGLWVLPVTPKGIYAQHVSNAKEAGLMNYLKMERFIHHNTDGPLNPYAKVYDVKEVQKDFSDFSVEHAHKEFMHAPPLPVHGLPGAGVMGWHLWVHLRNNKAA